MTEAPAWYFSSATMHPLLARKRSKIRELSPRLLTKNGKMTTRRPLSGFRGLLTLTYRRVVHGRRPRPRWAKNKTSRHVNSHRKRQTDSQNQGGTDFKVRKENVIFERRGPPPSTVFSLDELCDHVSNARAFPDMRDAISCRLRLITSAILFHSYQRRGTKEMRWVCARWSTWAWVECISKLDVCAHKLGRSNP